MEEQKKIKVEKTKKDILEEVKEIDRRVRAKIVYDKISTIKSWAREIAELKEKTQVLLEELGVETEDI
jgi:mevalonate kinase